MNVMVRIATILWQAIVRFRAEGGFANAGNLALSILLSLFPFLMLIAALVRVWGDPALADQSINIIFGNWPADSAKQVADQVKVMMAESPGEFFSVSTIFALILATNGVESARDGLNRAYGVIETRSFLVCRAQSAGFVLIGAFSLLTVAFVLVGSPIALSYLTQHVPLLSQFTFVLGFIQYAAAIFILALTLFSFHYFLPNDRPPISRMVWGIVLTIAGIILGSKLFAIYLLEIANYTALYAGLAGTMVAIVYLYGLSIMILFGAEFNAAYEKDVALRRTQTREERSPSA